MGCIFCKIVGGEIPSNKLYEDDLCLAFYDIAPKAPVHFLVIPKKHITSLDAIEGEEMIVGHVMAVAAALARQEGIAQGGYRVVTNIGQDGGQTVDHLHFHVLGGRSLSWPPG